MKNRKINGGMIRRFSPLRLAEHWVNAGAIVVLVLTGLAQKFHTLEASQWFVLHLSGIDTVRLIHHAAGVVVILLTLQHVLAASFLVVLRKGQPGMLISKKDVADTLDNLRYYFGLRQSPALCDRYDYKQKFEYWAILTGQILMTVSGLLLWFPTAAARFLPGEFIPAAKALHTNEALLIFLLIAVWHIYNAIFSPDVFPLDTSIFTGRISRQRMVHEHPLELARMQGIPLEAVLKERREEMHLLDAEGSLLH
jgi:cytochrome b subunit of formate dehydrogenase